MKATSARLLSLLGAAVLSSWTHPVSADDWPPVSPAEVAMRAPEIEPGADAEALLWDVRVAHEIEGGWLRTETSHHLRLKVFSEGGRERLGTVDIPYTDSMSVSGIAGRTIRPDGAITALDEASVYDRTIVKAGGLKVKAKSFALPGLQVGSIIEYRWKERLDDQITNYFRLPFQRDIPIHVVRYHLKPIDDPAFPYGMHNWSVHLRSGAFVKEKDGFYAVSASKIPSFREEPDMPAEAAVRSWMLVYYAPDTSEPPTKYWQTVGKAFYESYRGAIKLNDEMRAAAAQAVKDAQGDEEKLQKLLDYATRGFKEARPGAPQAGPETHQKEKDRENKNTLDTWRRQTGTGWDTTLLFLALAESLGYEARLARGSLRDFGPFDETFTDPYFLRTYSVAVKVGDAWRFCDPASDSLPFGMLRWNEQGQTVLVTDGKQPQLVTTPMAGPEDSLARRDATFRLSADGTLEGDVRTSYTGESAYGRKERFESQSAANREESVRDEVRGRFGAAEVAGIKVAGVSGRAPLEVSYHVRIPDYAQHSERRLFLQCAYFTRGGAPRYSASERRHPVSYPYAWSEKDSVIYELPEGYVLEKPEAPGAFRVVDLGEYVSKLTLSTKRFALRYDRSFDFGRGGHLLFPAQSYASLKQVFDKVQEQDDHTVVLRQGGN